MSYFTEKGERKSERIDFGVDGLVDKHWKFNKGEAILLRSYFCDRKGKVIVVKDHELSQTDSIWYEKGFKPYMKKRMRAGSLLYKESWMYIFNHGFNTKHFNDCLGCCNLFHKKK